MIDVDELLSQMTVEEKCAQLAGVWFAELATDHLPDPAKLESVLTHGIGQVSRISAQTGAAPVDTAAMANQIQRHLVEHTRLGIPAIVHELSTERLLVMSYEPGVRLTDLPALKQLGIDPKDLGASLKLELAPAAAFAGDDGIA